MAREQRKKLWVHPFQTGLLIRIALYCLVYQVASWAFFALCDQIDAALVGLKVEGIRFSNVFVRSALALLFLVPPLTLDAVRFAHRFVGPLYRIRKTMAAITAGEPVSLVKLRRGDMLLDFKDEFNQMLAQLAQRGLVVIDATASASDAGVPSPAEHHASGPHSQTTAAASRI